MAAWVYRDRSQNGTITLIALGDPACTPCRALLLDYGKLAAQQATATSAIA